MRPCCIRLLSGLRIDLRQFASISVNSKASYVDLRQCKTDICQFTSRGSQDDGPNVQTQEGNTEVPIHNGTHKGAPAAEGGLSHYGWVFLYCASALALLVHHLGYLLPSIDMDVNR
jgi:hypothetical protein